MHNNIILGTIAFVLIAIFAMVGYHTFGKDDPSSEISGTLDGISDSVGEVGEELGEAGEEVGDEIDDHTNSSAF